MEILIGLAIAAMLVLGWFAGNGFVCVFLTLPVALVGLYSLLSVNTAAGALALFASVAVICVIWAPFYYRRHFYYRRNKGRWPRSSHN